MRNWNHEKKNKKGEKVYKKKEGRRSTREDKKLILKIIEDELKI
jgi:hypothetical protein